MTDNLINYDFELNQKDMKRLIKILSLSLLSFKSNAQFTLTESFDQLSTLSSSGWIRTNNSNPIGTTNWYQGSRTANFPAQSGNGYIAADYNNTQSIGTISNWLISPVIQLVNGAKLKFYTRTLTNTFPDRLQVRLSINGSSSNVGTTETSVGDFMTLLCEINPSQSTTGGLGCGGAYPTTWTQYDLTIDNIGTQCTQGRIAFRYYVENAGIDAYNGEYIGIDNFEYNSTCPLLPVSLVAFTGSISADRSVLNWSTETEYNSDKFEILKSNDGISFSSIGFVNAAGNSSMLLNYNFIDEHPFIGNNYYQLKQIDISNKYELSKIIKLTNKNKNFKANIIQNPVSSICTINYSSVDIPFLNWNLLDANGRTLNNGIHLTNKSTNGIINIPVNKLTHGVYFVNLIVRNESYLLRFLKD